MKMHRFTGLTSRDVLRKVRDQLGDGALILSNRAVPGGIEVIAASDTHLDALVDTHSTAPKAAQRRPSTPAPIPEPAPVAEAGAEASLADMSAESPAQSALARLRSRFASRRSAPRDEAPAKTAGGTLQTRVDDDVVLGAAVPADDPLLASTRVLANLSLDRANEEAAQTLASTAQFIARRAAVEAEAELPVQRPVERPEPRTLRSFTERVEAQARANRAEAIEQAQPPKPDTRKRAHHADLFVRVDEPKAKADAAAANDDATGAQQRTAFQAEVKAELKAETEAMTRRMVGEIEVLKSTLNDAMSSLASLGVKLGDPVRTRLFQTMLNAGFSAQLTRYVLENMPQHDAYEGALDFVQRAIEKNLSTVSDENSLLDQGGVFALMGPTGVGKTTTTAKLAARFVLRHGASRVALLSTDSYRIGGHEQLRIYGKILGVTVHAVKDAHDLALALGDLREKHVVLIDTIGMSQRDRAVSEQMAMLHNAGPAIKRLLLLNATSNGKTLDEVVSAYRDANLAGSILTKIDEAGSVGHAVDVMIRHRLPLHYVSYGQRVPEDIAVPNKKLLVHRSFRAGAEQSSFALESEESLLVAQGATRSREPGLAAFDFA